MTLGRKPEVGIPTCGGRAAVAARGGPNPGAGVPGDNFNRPTDVAWDAAGNIFVADGYGNARIAKFDKNGTFLKSWGSRGTGQGQFDTAALARHRCARQRVRGRSRQQAHSGLRQRRQLQDARSPMSARPGPSAFRRERTSICTAPIPTTPNSMDNGEIYKLELDGTVLGKFGTRGQTAQGIRHRERDRLPQSERTLVGEITNWRVQRLRLRP